MFPYRQIDILGFGVDLGSLTPVAGPIFETKNRAIFSGELFSGEEVREKHYLSTTLFPLTGCGFINPRIRTFVERHFHRLFSKKKCSKSGGVPSFPRREHVPAVISLPSGQGSALDPYHKKNRATFFARESCSRAKFLSRKKLSRKYRSIFASKFRPATGVINTKN